MPSARGSMQQPGSWVDVVMSILSLTNASQIVNYSKISNFESTSTFVTGPCYGDKQRKNNLRQLVKITKYIFHESQHDQIEEQHDAV